MTTYAVGAELSLVQIDGLALAAQGSPRALAMLAEKVADGANKSRAVELALQSQALAPDDPEILSITQRIIGDSVPLWHFDIVKDETRNSAFQAAISRAVKPDSRVLDIGSGTGLLAMMAAGAGAKHVTSCEMNPAIADVATQIVAANGFADTVSIVSKHSMDVDPVQDMGGQADIIVSEIVGNDFVCEGVLPALQDAARRLLKPGGKMIPQTGSVIVALAYWDRLSNVEMGEVCGFDMMPFNRLRPSKLKVQVADPKLSLRSESATLFEFNFASTELAATKTKVELGADGKPINGIAQWIRLGMDDEGSLENRPGPDAKSSWACQFFPLQDEIQPDAGTMITVSGGQTTNNLRIWVN
jgi:type II protein arginine methyltransferase